MREAWRIVVSLGVIALRYLPFRASTKERTRNEAAETAMRVERILVIFVGKETMEGAEASVCYGRQIRWEREVEFYMHLQ